VAVGVFRLAGCLLNEASRSRLRFDSLLACRRIDLISLPRILILSISLCRTPSKSVCCVCLSAAARFRFPLKAAKIVAPSPPPKLEGAQNSHRTAFRAGYDSIQRLHTQNSNLPGSRTSLSCSIDCVSLLHPSRCELRSSPFPAKSGSWRMRVVS